MTPAPAPGTTSEESAELKRRSVHRRAQGPLQRRRADLPGLTGHDRKIAPSIYYAHHERQAAPAARTLRDAELKTLIRQAYETNYRVYGARKIWRHLDRQEVTVARCTFERRPDAGDRYGQDRCACAGPGEERPPAARTGSLR
ncbi:IS3 family transposase [Streptomyces sp. NPDC058459]|uniref:IS3 family transposase n=1 Tax=Streptomyces sp. NPDC058459 TaxID=3346508 RepID=UPI00364D61F7